MGRWLILIWLHNFVGISDVALYNFTRGITNAISIIQLLAIVTIVAVNTLTRC